MKFFDCFMYHDEDLVLDIRLNILNQYINKFVIIESRFDHQGNKKKLNFKLANKEFVNKIKYIVIEEQFPNPKNGWDCEKFQREKLLLGLKDANNDDYIMYSDSDEIPNPEMLKSISLNSKYGIFLQKMFVYKLNVYNSYETPWEGTRICKKKHLKSIDWLRQKVLSKNLKYGFWRIYKERNIQIIDNGGWHFNYLLDPKDISKKFKSLAETSWDKEKFYNEKIIEDKIKKKQDLFERGHTYEYVSIDDSYPDYLRENLNKYSKWIINE